MTLTSNTVGLDFDPEAKTTVIGTLAHEVDDGAVRWYEEASPPVQHSRLMQAAGQEVVDCVAENDVTLVIRLANGHIVRCVGDCGPYECYELKVGFREIIV